MEDLYCTSCGRRTFGSDSTPSSPIVEAGLYAAAVFAFAFSSYGVITLLFAIAHSVWRHSRRGVVCSHCDSPNPVPFNSPAAIAARRENFEQRVNAV